jgi:hypothetical protein
LPAAAANTPSPASRTATDKRQIFIPAVFDGELSAQRCTMRRVFSVQLRRMDAKPLGIYPSRFIPPRHERVGFDSVADKNNKVTLQ